MDWWRFLFWNAAGGVVWATVVGLAGDALGRAALDVLSHIDRLVSGV
jgi:membrane protein DedA with SNARE-associated domain